MVRRDIVARKTARATSWLDDAEALLSQPLEAFRSDAKTRDLASFYLFLAIQECIDLAAHVLADAGWSPPDDAVSSFDVLAERGFIDAELADAMRGAAGLRNRIAHGYAMLDHRRLHAEASEGIPALRRFLIAVVNAADV